jgi:hypothetical protein
VVSLPSGLEDLRAQFINRRPHHVSSHLSCGSSHVLLCDNHLSNLHLFICGSLSHACLITSHQAKLHGDMPPHACDEMDEFFDFSALVQDHRSDISCNPQLLQSDAIYSMDNVVAMDWAMDWTTDSATIHPTDVILPYETQTHEMPSELYTAHESQQWPLDDHDVGDLALNGNGSMVPPATSTWQQGSYTPANDLIYNVSRANSPPLSSSFAHTQSELIADNDDEGSVDMLGTPRESIPAQHKDVSIQGSDILILETQQAVSPFRPSGPLRPSTNASWKPASAKRKGPQSRIPLEAKQILEDEFAANPYPCSWEIDIIAHQANLDVKKVRNWFNNTRARAKGGGKCVPTLSVLEVAYVYRTQIHYTANARYQHTVTEIKAVEGQFGDAEQAIRRRDSASSAALGSVSCSVLPRGSSRFFRSTSCY